MRGVKSERVQADEIWSFCYARAKNVAMATAAPEGAGDVRMWTALDADTKLMVSYFVSDRSRQSAFSSPRTGLAPIPALLRKLSGPTRTTPSLRRSIAPIRTSPPAATALRSASGPRSAPSRQPG